MATRTLLKSQLFRAWERSIRKDYCGQRINSERSLQASYWAQLNRLLHANTRRMFIEPRLVVESEDGPQVFYPDLVICNTRQVIAVIELKYQPRAFPKHDKDIKTLRTIAENRVQLRVSNSRFRGPEKDAREYGFSDDVVFVWAGIYMRPKNSSYANRWLLSNGGESLSRCWFQLHAETDHSSKPDVFCLPRLS